MRSLTALALVATAVTLAGCTVREADPQVVVETETYPSGAIAVERQVRQLADGATVLHGTVTTYYQDGEKRSEGRYVDGLAEGAYTVWDLGGWKSSEIQFVRGKRQGHYQRWYADGALERQETYRDDRLDGPAATWHSNGVKRSEGLYAGGKRDGTWRYWDPQGDLLRTESWALGVMLAESTAD